MFKSVLRAVKNVFGSNVKKPACSQPFRRTRLNLEQLEARDCPAVAAYTVTGLGDAGAGMGNMGDLKYCIAQANANPGADTIQFQQGLTGEINPANPYAITGDLTITGPGADTIQIRGANADVTQNRQLVRIDAGVTCAISGLTFERGYASATLGPNGGAIENMGGNLTVTNCWFGYNRAAMNGGAIFNGAEGRLEATGCKFYENIAGNFGGAIDSDGVTVTLSETSLTKNSATAAASQGGAIYIYAGTLSVMGCQISENTAALGGGILLESGTTATIGGASDIGKNTAQLGGGILMRGAPGGPSGVTTLNVTNTTFHENNGTTNGGGIYMDGPTILTLDQTVTFAFNVSPPGTGDGISYKLGESSIIGDPILMDDAIIGRP